MPYFSFGGHCPPCPLQVRSWSPSGVRGHTLVTRGPHAKNGGLLFISAASVRTMRNRKKLAFPEKDVTPTTIKQQFWSCSSIR